MEPENNHHAFAGQTNFENSCTARWLAPYGKLYGHREDDKCECGAKETVAHVILDCPKLRTPRQKLRKEVGEAFGDISAMLGGKGDTSHVTAVLDFAEASQRFRSRGPRGPQG